MSQFAPAELKQACPPRVDVASAYGIEGLTSISGCLLMIGIPFFTTERFGWSSGQNLLLIMALGVAYTIGALLAGPLARRANKAKALVGVNIGLVLFASSIALSSSAATLVSLLFGYVLISTLTWPLVESLVTEGCDAHHINRRITYYNLIWSAINMVIIALYGTILQRWPAGPLVIPVVCQAFSLSLAIALVVTHRPPVSVEPVAHGDAEVAAQLANSRRMAMWLSRIALPASFVVANALMGIFPTTKISAEIGLALASLVAAVWMVGRFGVFLVLGLTSFWHTRPRLLLYGSGLMLLSFLAIVLPAERFGPFESMSSSGIVAVLVVAELVFGVVAGFVCSASLYFGMVLSEGSADHGGYHEALIGAGVVLGPGLAAGAQRFAAPGSNLPGIITVTALMVVTVAAASFAARRFRARRSPS